jgi:ssDNA-binding Zn-finger/Zn-ribbon topoisomerase 1
MDERDVESLLHTHYDDLPRTNAGKVICPVCKASGWYRQWWDGHRRREHVQCPKCGRWVLSLKKHEYHAHSDPERVSRDSKMRRAIHDFHQGNITAPAALQQIEDLL